MLGELRFAGAWRHYQELALDAFEADRAAGRRSTHLVAPPGLRQDPARLRDPPPARRAGARARAELGDPGPVGAGRRGVRRARGAGRGRARRRRSPASPTRRSRGSRTRAPRCAARRRRAGSRSARRRPASRRPRWPRRPRAWTGAAARRRERELARITASLKREIARGGDPAVRLADLLAPGARERVDALRAGGVATVVLDECHHLASLVGLRRPRGARGARRRRPRRRAHRDAAGRADDAGGRALRGAARAGRLPGADAGRRARRLPRAVPGAGVADRAAGRRAAVARRARDALPRARRPTSSTSTRTGRSTSGSGSSRGCATAARGDGDEVPWSDFQRRHPALAAAGVRFLGSAGLPLPPGAPRGEAYRRPPDLDDWVVLLEDWVLRCLDAAPDPRRRRAPRGGRGRAARPRLRAHPDRHPARRVGRRPAAGRLGGEADRAGRGPRRRGGGARRRPARAGAVRRRAGGRAPRRRAARHPRPDAGTARAAVRALADDTRTAVLRPLLVSGRGLRCAEDDARRAARRARAGRDARPSRLDGGAVGRRARRAAAAPATGGRGAGSRSRRRAFDGGRDAGARRHPRVPRRGLERAVRQLPRRPHERGDRRLGAPDARPLAAPRPGRPREGRVELGHRLRRARHAQGDADYERFVRKHRHLHAPADDGTLEAGVGHVHPDLSPFAPPPPGRFAEIARAMVRRARRTATPPARAGGSARRTRGTRSTTLVLRARRRRRRPRRPPRRRAPLAHRRGERLLLGGGAAGRRGGARRRRGRRAGRARRAPPRRGARGRRRGARPRARRRGYPRRRAARPDRPRGLRRLRRAGRAAARGGRLARVRAARVGVPALPAPRGDPGGGRARHRRPRRPARPGRASALPRLAARSRRRTRRRSPLLRLAAGAHGPLVDGLARRAGRPRPPQGARGGASPPPGAAGSGRRSWRFTQRDGPGREALAAAVAQEWSYDTQRRAVWQ